MNTDAFSRYHPLVNLLFFAGAVGCSVLILHPAYLLAAVLAGLSYHFLLSGAKGLPLLGGAAILFLFVTAINPLFNTYGSTVLFRLFDRPYTMEALWYGAAAAGVFAAMLFWFSCIGSVLTTDKLIGLFANRIPSLSLLIVMVIRMIPSLLRKAAQIRGARRGIGKAAAEGASLREKGADGAAVLSTLTSWALEGGVVTGDSMRARGYGTAKRTAFTQRKLRASDGVLLLILLFLLLATGAAAVFGQTEAVFVPDCRIAPLSWGIVPYTAYLFIPTILHIKEAVQWHISRSKI